MTRVVRTYEENGFTVNVLASGGRKRRNGRAVIAGKDARLPPADYAAYIRSSAWAKVKRRYRASKLPQHCAVCGDAKVDLHHRTYKRLGNERLTDLIPLCRPHHGDVHAMVKESANRSKVNLWSAVRRLRRQYVREANRDLLESHLDAEYRRVVEA